MGLKARSYLSPAAQHVVTTSHLTAEETEAERSLHSCIKSWPTRQRWCLFLPRAPAQ